MLDQIEKVLEEVKKIPGGRIYWALGYDPLDPNLGIKAQNRLGMAAPVSINVGFRALNWSEYRVKPWIFWDPRLSRRIHLEKASAELALAWLQNKIGPKGLRSAAR